MATATSKAAAKRQEQQEALDRLRGWLKPGDTVYCILRHKSKSGMSRIIDLIQIEDGQVRTLGYNAALALGWSYDRERKGIKVSGCGMDMGFHTVYALGSALWPNGTDKPHGTRNGEPDSDGGYALKSRWL